MRGILTFILSVPSCGWANGEDLRLCVGGDISTDSMKQVLALALGTGFFSGALVNTSAHNGPSEWGNQKFLRPYISTQYLM